MIEAEQDALSGHQRIVLLPNASMSKRQVNVLLLAFAAAMASIAAFFASMGAWAVLPFSGAEWLLLVFCFRMVLKRSAIREVITITDGVVRVERGRDKVERAHQWQRVWVNVDWVRSSTPGHPSRLYLRLHGRRIEIGEFLVESERAKLASDLQRILLDSRSL